MSWKEDLSRMISERWAVGELFTLSQTYRFVKDLRIRHPENLHVREKIRQTLQVLRDEGELRFIDEHGTYTRVK